MTLPRVSPSFSPSPPPDAPVGEDGLSSPERDAERPGVSCVCEIFQGGVWLRGEGTVPCSVWNFTTWKSHVTDGHTLRVPATHTSPVPSSSPLWPAGRVPEPGREPAGRVRAGCTHVVLLPMLSR